jgi:hypothetical protein
VKVIRKRGKHWYGETIADIREVLSRYGGKVDPLSVFADATCDCGGRVFSLQVSEEYGEAAWFCKLCHAQYLFHDRNINGYYEGHPKADTECCGCPCTKRGASYFEITVGASLYDDSEDVRWLYIGCRCVARGLTACYADWNRVDIPCPKLFAHMRNKQHDD